MHSLQLQNASNNNDYTEDFEVENSSEDELAFPHTFLVKKLQFGRRGRLAEYKTPEKMSDLPTVPTLVGIISWGLGCARPAYAGDSSRGGQYATGSRARLTDTSPKLVS